MIRNNNFNQGFIKSWLAVFIGAMVLLMGFYLTYFETHDLDFKLSFVDQVIENTPSEPMVEENESIEKVSSEYSLIIN